MSLKIENLKLDKDIYIFGVDKEIKGSFTLISDGKGYKINSVNIKHGVIFYLNDNEHSINLENLIIAENVQILGNESQKFEFIVPINYPNVLENKNSHTNNDDIELKNYIEIIVDISLSFGLKEELYPNVILNLPIDNNFEKTEEVISYENNPDYINIGFPWDKKDYIKKELYEKIKAEHKDFKIREYVRERILNFFWLVFITLIIDFIIGIGGINLLSDYISYETSKIFSGTMMIISGILISIIIYFSIIIFIGMLYIKRHIIKIMFNEIIKIYDNNNESPRGRAVGVS